MNTNELIIQYQNTRDPEALKQLIKQYNPFLWKQANAKCENMSGNTFTLEDLYQEACIAFEKAIVSFNPYAGAKITTYAKTKILHEFNEYDQKFRQEWSVTQDHYEFNQTIHRCIKEVDPSFVKGETNLSNQEIEQVVELLVKDLERKYKTTTSPEQKKRYKAKLQKPTLRDEYRHKIYDFFNEVQVIRDHSTNQDGEQTPGVEGFSDGKDLRNHKKDLHSILEKHIAELPYLQQVIINENFAIEDNEKKSIKELSESLNISESEANRLKKLGLANILNALTPDEKEILLEHKDYVQDRL